jgi:hypothetical protein
MMICSVVLVRRDDEELMSKNGIRKTDEGYKVWVSSSTRKSRIGRGRGGTVIGRSHRGKPLLRILHSPLLFAYGGD